MSTDPADLAAELGLVYESYAHRARYNVPPGADVPVVISRAGSGGEVVNQMRTAHWGLIPSWAKEAKIGFRAFNARSETVAKKPMFKKALAARRCVVPVNGYYEWEKTESGKQPWLMHARDDAWLFMAGLFEFKKLDGPLPGIDAGTDPAVYDDWLVSTTIITQPSAGHLAELHDRMPVMMDRDRIFEWTDPSLDIEDAQALLGELRAVFDPDDVDRHRVDSAVGNVRNDYPGLTAPV